MTTFEPTTLQLLHFYFAFTLSKFGVVFVPILIVAFWRSRPRMALLLAIAVIFLLLFIPGVIRTYQGAITFGHNRVAVGIKDSLIIGCLGVLLYTPLLILSQWISRKIFKPSRATTVTE